MIAALIADTIIVLAQTFVVSQFSAWFFQPISIGHAVWLVALLRALNIALYRKGAREPWFEALGQTGVVCAIVLLIGWVVKSVFVGAV